METLKEYWNDHKKHQEKLAEKKGRKDWCWGCNYIKVYAGEKCHKCGTQN